MNRLSSFAFFILIVVNSSCSFLTKVTVLESSKTPAWKDCSICYTYSEGRLTTKSYQLNADSFLITVCPGAKPGFNFLFGPPFVPIIPNPFIVLPAKPNTQFFVDMKVDNKGNSLTLDLSKIQFQFFKDSLIRPSSIRLLADKYYGQPKEFFHNHVDHPDSIVNNTIVTVTNPLILRFEFPVLTTKVKRLSISFDSISTINFRKRVKFIYKPFVFTS